jgi:tetratricopeptide (TPR) repeat protein
MTLGRVSQRHTTSHEACCGGAVGNGGGRRLQSRLSFVAFIDLSFIPYCPMAQSADSPSPPAHRSRWLIGAAVGGALALTAAVAYFSFRNDLSPQECEQLEAKKNIAIGYLENGPHRDRPKKLPEADALFQEIAREKPGDPLALRDLVITRLLYLESISDPESRSRVAQKAGEAAQELIASDEASAIACLLSARIARFVGDERRAEDDLNRAVALDPDDAVLWYQLYSFLEGAKEEVLQKKAPDALRHVYQRAPDNLAVQLKWLQSQALAKDRAISETIEAMCKSIAKMPGLVVNVAKNSNGAMPDPLAWLDTVNEAAAKEDWRTAYHRAGLFANLVRPEPLTQSDLRRIDRHPLDFVIHEFQTPCPKRAEPRSSQRAKVTLSEFPAGEQPPALVGINDVVLADFDLDERLDLIVLRETAVEVYSRSHGSSAWRRIVEAPLSTEYGHLLVVDLDRDDPQQPGTEAYRRALEQKHAPSEKPGDRNEHSGPPANSVDPSLPCHRADLDVVVFGPAGVQFLKNTLNDDKTRSLVEVPQSAELGELTKVTAVAAADFYHDGDLDIALVAEDGLHLWSNRGDLTFSDITGFSQLPPSGYRPSSILAVDWDRDIDLDLILADAGGQPAGYLENLRHGQFRWRAFEAGFDALVNARSIELLDGGHGGWWSLAAAGESGATLIQSGISRSGIVTLKPSQRLSRTACRGQLTWDFDNDGNTDLLTWSENTIDFFSGTPDGSLASMPSLLALVPQNIRVCRSGDLDGDGDEDLLIAETGRISLYANLGGNENPWIDAELRAGVVETQTISFRANHYGIGSIIEVESGSRIQRKMVAAAKTHFGLGSRSRPDSLRVVWTTGVPQHIVEPGTNLVICDEQVIGGSCPYLYTWNGERFAFCTDCLWSAPLGLQLAEGHLAPSRAWEYLRIGGDQLREKNGFYDLQVTEELWEAAYLDELRLIAVDHPAEVDVYSNEKVGPAEIAQFTIHTVRQPHRPVAAHDHQGRDILDRIAERDAIYVKPFDHRLAFGYTEDHFIELDFGRLENPREIKLFLTGWIFPSGTSMNVAISQNPGLKPPAPPSLWVPDAGGRWREALPCMGFPGGKTKTIVIELTGAFLTDDYRVRIATNMEIYWDEAFLAVDEQPTNIRQAVLHLIDADLHYRGFSHRQPGKQFGPEHYDYNQVSIQSKWPAMGGHFTRYGDVRELLTNNDDRLVVLGAGDELTLRFVVPETNPPPSGWTRDFLLYNVGWDKDCDLNTIYGETVEPLPFGRMSGYPFVDDGGAFDTDTYREYVRTYQTRTQDPRLFWQH